jgi:mRNA interferase RelE/StbE
MDKTTLKRVVDYMDEIATLIDPRSRGKSLVGNLKGLWRYRVGDHRIICQITNDQLIILVTDVAHGKHVYKKKN